MCYECLEASPPIIATAKSEFEFVTYRELGLTIEKTDRETTADAIRALYETDAETRERMGVRGREYVLENHTWAAMVEQILSDLSSHPSRPTAER